MLFRTVHDRIRSKQLLLEFLNSFHQTLEIPESASKLGGKVSFRWLPAEARR